MKFLGLSFWFWSVVCTAIAVIYFFVYPEPNTGNVFLNFSLRYFHSFTWLVLLLACLTAIFTQSRHAANSVASVALIFYGLFMISFVLSRGS